MKKHEEIKQTIFLIKNDFTLETKELISMFLKIFNILEVDSLSHESYVKYDIDADYVKIKIVSIDSIQMNFSFEFFKGLTEIFIDDSIELILQYRFKNSDDAFDYFKKCLFCEIYASYFKNKDDKIIKYNYKFILYDKVIMEIGNNCFFLRIFCPKSLNKKYHPWINKIDYEIDR